MTLDPVIHQATRLRIMTALFRNREASFTSLRDGLRLTDGNLGSHAQTLEKAGYLASRRALGGLGFEVRYRITPRGSQAFVAYTRALRELLGGAMLDGAAREEEHEPGDRRDEREDEDDDARHVREPGERATV